MPLSIRIPVVAACLLVASLAAAEPPGVTDLLRAEIESLSATGRLSTAEEDIAARRLIIEVYERRNFAPAWLSAERVTELLDVVRAAEADGLTPDDYHVAYIDSLHAGLVAGQVVPDARLAQADIVMTDAVVRLAYHELFGKVDPGTLDPDWNFSRRLGDRDPVSSLLAILDARDLADSMATLVPRGWFYRQLREGLADYRRIGAQGGWESIPGGPAIRPGQADDRLAALASRLAISGDLDGLAAAFPVYDGALVEAVKRFQRRHALDADGIVGSATVAALNVAVAQRIRQLELSLERARWVTKDLGDDFVLVNIAGFYAAVYRNREAIWSTRVQVGTAYRKSPVFRDEIRYLDFNPTWTVPYSIATRDILPQIQKDPGYLAQRNFIVRSRDGAIVDPVTVEWSAYGRNNFPFTLVQQPGPANALGRVKFMFPNEHAVYLHDTPSRALFDRAQRAFSSGCIRVEKPFELAELLLGDAGWNQKRFQEVLDSRETRTVRLTKPMPVLLLYWTAEVDPEGTVYFYEDIYDRDAAVSAALDAPFSLVLPRD